MYRLIMSANDFLRDFKSSSNEELYHKMLTNSGVNKEINTLFNEAQNHKTTLLNDMPSLENPFLTEMFINQHEFWRSDKTFLLVVNSAWKFIGYKTYDPKTNFKTEMLADLLKTDHAAYCLLIHPVNSLDKENVSDELKRLKDQLKDLQDACKGIERQLIDCMIAEKSSVQNIDSTYGISFFRKIKFDSSDPTKDIVLPTVPTTPYKNGFKEFCEYYATQKIVGKNIWDDRSRVQNLIQLGYGFFDHEKCGILHLDENSNITKMQTISSGASDRVTIYSDIVSRELITHDSKEWVLFHNHPNGESRASGSDVTLTSYLTDVTKHLEIPLIEHFIIGQEVYSLTKDPTLSNLQVSKNAETSYQAHLERQVELER